MAENTSIYNIKRNFPFVSTKRLPLVDLYIRKDPIVYIASVSEDKVLFNNTEKEIAYATDIHDIGHAIKIFDSVTDENIGFFVIDKYIPYPQTFTSEETTIIPSLCCGVELNFVRSISVTKKNGRAIDLGPSIRIRHGTNMESSKNGDILTLSAITRANYSGYLKSLKIGGKQTRANRISISGTDIVRIEGNIFDTAIEDFNLKCPVVFDAGSRGDQGPKGPTGLPGITGLSNLINCGTKQQCDPCIQLCGAYDSFCDIPPMPDFEYPPLPEIPDIELPDMGGCPIDVEVPMVKMPPAPPGGGGQQCPVDFGELESFDELGGSITYVLGLHISNMSCALSGQKNCDYTYFTCHSGTPSALNGFNNTNSVQLPLASSYVVKFDNIEYIDGGSKIGKFYFLYGFRKSSPDYGGSGRYVGNICFNTPNCNSENPFEYCVDEDCKPVMFYETINEDFTGEFPGRSMGTGAIDQVRAHIENKKVYVIFLETKKVCRIINVAHDANGFAGNTPSVTIYDTTLRKKYSNKPLKIYYSTRELYYTTYNLVTQKMTHPLAELGLLCNDHRYRYIPTFWGWNSDSKSYITCELRKCSPYKNIDKVNSRIRHYNPHHVDYTDVDTIEHPNYLDEIKADLLFEANILNVIPAQNALAPIILETEEIYRSVSGADFGHSTLGLFAFTKETFATGVSVNRVHMLINSFYDDTGYTNAIRQMAERRVSYTNDIKYLSFPSLFDPFYNYTYDGIHKYCDLGNAGRLIAMAGHETHDFSVSFYSTMNATNVIMKSANVALNIGDDVFGMEVPYWDTANIQTLFEILENLSVLFYSPICIHNGWSDHSGMFDKFYEWLKLQLPASFYRPIMKMKVSDDTDNFYSVNIFPEYIQHPEYNMEMSTVYTSAVNFENPNLTSFIFRRHYEPPLSDPLSAYVYLNYKPPGTPVNNQIYMTPSPLKILPVDLTGDRGMFDSVYMPSFVISGLGWKFVYKDGKYRLSLNEIDSHAEKASDYTNPNGLYTITDVGLQGILYDMTIYGITDFHADVQMIYQLLESEKDEWKEWMYNDFEYMNLLGYQCVFYHDGLVGTEITITHAIEDELTIYTMTWTGGPNPEFNSTNYPIGTLFSIQDEYREGLYFIGNVTTGGNGSSFKFKSSHVHARNGFPYEIPYTYTFGTEVEGEGIYVCKDPKATALRIHDRTVSGTIELYCDFNDASIEYQEGDPISGEKYFIPQCCTQKIASTYDRVFRGLADQETSGFRIIPMNYQSWISDIP